MMETCQIMGHCDQRIREPVTGHVQLDRFGGRWDAHQGEKDQGNDTAGENPRTPHELSPLWMM